MAQPCMLARDIAALACVNKTAAAAARESGWHALLMRTLPHAADRDAFATLRAYEEVTIFKADKLDEMASRFVCCIRHEDGTPLFSTAFGRLHDDNKVLTLPPVLVPGVVMGGEEKYTASLFVEVPPADGRGGVRVACIYNLLSVSRIFDAVEPALPVPESRWDLSDYVIDKWLQTASNSVLASRGRGRVFVFSNVPEAYSYHDPRPKSGHFKVVHDRHAYIEGDWIDELHVGCFAVLVHVPADGGTLSVWPQLQVKYEIYDNALTGTGAKRARRI
jgi:hypothetical protein